MDFRSSEGVFGVEIENFRILKFLKIAISERFKIRFELIFKSFGIHLASFGLFLVVFSENPSKTWGTLQREGRGAKHSPSAAKSILLKQKSIFSNFGQWSHW